MVVVTRKRALQETGDKSSPNASISVQKRPKTSVLRKPPEMEESDQNAGILQGEIEENIWTGKLSAALGSQASDSLELLAAELKSAITDGLWTPHGATEFPKDLIQFSTALVNSFQSCKMTDSILDRLKHSILCFEDVKLLSLRQIFSILESSLVLNERQQMGLFELLSRINPSSVGAVPKRRFLTDYGGSSARSNLPKQLKLKRIRSLYSNIWLRFTKCKLSNSVLKRLLPWLASDVLSEMTDATLLMDFFVGCSEMGDPFNYYALHGLFILIHKHGLEYPDFYGSVYLLLQPSVLYSSHKRKFLELVDVFLDSTHLPAYTVAAFAKRLAGLALLAPLDAVEALTLLIRNILVRHPAVRSLIHRSTPTDLTTATTTAIEDPFLPQEADLSKCRVMDSSLWEIKALQRHWLPDVSKRARFVDSELPPMEAFLRWRSFDQIFEAEMEKYKEKTDDATEMKEVPTTFVPPKGLFTNESDSGFHFAKYFC